MVAGRRAVSRTAGLPPASEEVAALLPGGVVPDGWVVHPSWRLVVRVLAEVRRLVLLQDEGPFVAGLASSDKMERAAARPLGGTMTHLLTSFQLGSP